MTSKSSLATDRVVDEIERSVLGSVVRVGEMLPSERELASQMGVSRTVIRESLRRLQERGLVEAQPGRGSFYRPAEPTDAAESLNRLFRRSAVTPAQLIAARTLLECESAALAAIHRTEGDCAELERILGGFTEGKGVLELAHLDIAFHDRIAQASANPVVHLMLASISDITVGLMVRSLSDRQVRSRGLPLHDDVLAAIAAADAERAREAMGGHLALAEQLYGDDLHRELGEVIPPELRDALQAFAGGQATVVGPLVGGSRVRTQGGA
jgi:GntR family transcriptional repressor for pyruvate dehydrogenase complex